MIENKMLVMKHEKQEASHLIIKTKDPEYEKKSDDDHHP